MQYEHRHVRSKRIFQITQVAWKVLLQRRLMVGLKIIPTSQSGPIISAANRMTVRKWMQRCVFNKILIYGFVGFFSMKNLKNIIGGLSTIIVAVTKLGVVKNNCGGNKTRSTLTTTMILNFQSCYQIPIFLTTAKSPCVPCNLYYVPVNDRIRMVFISKVSGDELTLLFVKVLAITLCYVSMFYLGFQFVLFKKSSQ